MTTYVRELSAGEIIRGAVSLYRQNFATMFLIALAFAPANLLHVLLPHDLLTQLIYIVVASFLSLIVYSALVVAVSDACTGSKPSVLRSYKQVPRNFLSLCTVGAIQGAAVVGGLILLIVPGVLFALWFMLAPVVVILEKTGGVAALKRSKGLGKGFYGRNFGLLLFFVLLLSIPAVLVAVITGGVFGAISGAEATLRVVAEFEGVFMTSLMYPIFFTGLVLIYYDLRARKESYDSTALMEDLRR